MIDRKDLEEYFEQRVEERISGHEDDVSVLSSAGSVLDLISVFVNYVDKYGLYISFAAVGENPYKDFDQTLSENLPFVEELDRRKQLQIEVGLIESEWTLLLFEEEETMNEYYDQINRHGVDSFPFYATTIHKSGAILRENT